MNFESFVVSLWNACFGDPALMEVSAMLNMMFFIHRCCNFCLPLLVMDLLPFLPSPLKPEMIPGDGYEYLSDVVARILLLVWVVVVLASMEPNEVPFNVPLIVLGTMASALLYTIKRSGFKVMSLALLLVAVGFGSFYRTPEEQRANLLVIDPVLEKLYAFFLSYSVFYVFCESVSSALLNCAPSETTVREADLKAVRLLGYAMAAIHTVLMLTLTTYSYQADTLSFDEIVWGSTFAVVGLTIWKALEILSGHLWYVALTDVPPYRLFRLKLTQEYHITILISKSWMPRWQRNTRLDPFKALGHPANFSTDGR